MERQSIVGQIYGYGVSLIAILIIIIAIHGIVNSAFRVVNPAAGAHGPRMLMMWRMHGGPHMGGPAATAPAAPGTDQGPDNAMQPNVTVASGGPGAVMRGRMVGDARFDAFRMLVVQIVMLIVGIVLLRWHWNWLHTTRTA